MRHYMPKETLKNIYFSFIQSHLNHGIINWGSAVPTILEPINFLMKKAVRFMTFSEKDTHSPSHFKELGIMNLSDMIKLEWCKVIYRTFTIMQCLCLYNHYLPTSLTSTATILGSLQQERFSYLLYEQKKGKTSLHIRV